MEVVMKLPHAGAIKGMGIPRGVTLIVGGGYHGKSTLLSALESGVYNHIAGDGREYVVSKGKIKQASNTYKTLREPLDLDIPIAVLVNSGTASASAVSYTHLETLHRKERKFSINSQCKR